MSEGEFVTARTTFSGTHDGEFHGLPPTEAEFEVTEFMMFRVSGAEMEGFWFAWDELGFWEQLGILEHPLRG